MLTLPAVSENVVEVDPWGTVIFAGRLTSAGDAPSPIVAPPLGAADVRATVHFDPADGETDVGLHERLLKVGTCPIVTVAPLAVVAIPAPLESADIPFVS